MKSVCAQEPLIINPGKDTNYCVNLENLSKSIYIGSRPTAKGGNPPYKYKWELYSKDTRVVYNLLHSQNVDTLANSSIRFSNQLLNGIYVLKLTVTDNNQTKKTDSCYIGISVMINTLNISVKELINDSITLQKSSLNGGVPPFSYHWKPEIGVSNPFIAEPKAKPIIDISLHNYQDYQVEITDAIGCKTIDNGTRVFVKPTGIEELHSEKITNPNPVSNSGTINFTTELLGSILQIVSVGGAVVYQTKVEAESLPVGSLLPVAGVYFYRLTTPLGKVINGSFVKE